MELTFIEIGKIEKKQIFWGWGGVGKGVLYTNLDMINLRCLLHIHVKIGIDRQVSAVA